MRSLVIATALLITYGSLYPFNFDLDLYDSSLLADLFDFHPGRIGRGDLVANIVLFFPLGFVAMQAAEGRSMLANWLTILFGSFLLAHAIQIVQIVIPGRVPAASDTILNVLGCALGCLLGMIRLHRLNLPAELPRGPLPVPTLLALFLILWNLRPFVPSIDLQLLIDNIKHLVADPIPHPLWTFQGIVTWLIIFHFLDSEDFKLIPERHFPTLAIVTLTLGFFIVGNSANIDRIVGALLALPLWRVLRQSPRAHILSFLMLILLIAIGFTPFELRDEVQRFNWIPFSGALSGNLFINVLSTAKKMLLYGSFIYLLIQTNIRPAIATVAVSLFLLLIEFLQVFFVNRTPEITDSLLALMIGLAFYLWEDRRKKAPSISTGSLKQTSLGRAAGQSGPGEEGDGTLDTATAPGGIAQEIPGSVRRLVLNLRESQAIFLEHVSREARLEPSEVCQRLIERAVHPDAGWQDDPLFSSPAPFALDSYSPASGGGHWTQLSIQIDGRRFDSLNLLAIAGSKSHSRTLRHLLATYINESTVTSGHLEK